jgi:Ca2+-binding EF-hand superfamily protein
MLKKNLDALNKKFEESQNGSGWQKLSLSELNSLKLPLNVSDWRAAHVQAWLAFQMEYPQYVPAFQEASVDGLVLLGCIEEDTLNDQLGVTVPLHRRKIMEGIRYLQDQENAKKKTEESKLKRELRQHIESQPQKKKKKGKKTKKNAPPLTKTWTGVVREENEIERVKLIRDMKAYREAQARAAKRKADSSKTWKFEYTGADKPRDDGIWAEDGLDEKSRAFQKTMGDLLNTTQQTQGGYVGPVRVVPSNLSFDELLTVIKGAMYDTSSRLIRVEENAKKRQAVLDSDLESDDGVDDEDVLPPAYREIDDPKEFGSDPEGPPPPYEMARGSSAQHNSRSSSKMKSQTSIFGDKKPDRMGLIFKAFVDQHNNGARWIGQNSKLTRLKFYGGFESILRLRVDWPHFDALWNQLDYMRSGELDKDEFTKYFGDLSEFESKEGAFQLSTQAGSESMKVFTRALFEFCDVLRNTGFSVLDIFSSFDRNGSGEVSISEFCSMLRTVLGKDVDKKQIFRAYSLFDEDNSKSISLDEVLQVVYKIWKAQLDELADRLSKLDEDIDKARIDKIIAERAVLKECVKKNFPRQWRDRMARVKGDKLTGPFTHLLASMNIGTTKFEDTASRASQLCAPPSPDNSSPVDRTLAWSGQPESPSRRPHSATAPIMLPHPPAKEKGSTAINAHGRNEVMRFKLVQPESHVPHRSGAILTQPRVASLNDSNLFSGEGAQALLRRTEPKSLKINLLTSDK